MRDRRPIDTEAATDFAVAMILGAAQLLRNTIGMGRPDEPGDDG